MQLTRQYTRLQLYWQQYLVEENFSTPMDNLIGRLCTLCVSGLSLGDDLVLGDEARQSQHRHIDPIPGDPVGRSIIP